MAMELDLTKLMGFRDVPPDTDTPLMQAMAETHNKVIEVVLGSSKTSTVVARPDGLPANGTEAAD